MRRRTLLGGLTTAVAGMLVRSGVMAGDRTESERRVQEYMAKALANFPYELVETTGKDAYTKWLETRAAGRGTPVILGGDESSYNNLFTPFGDNGPHIPPAPSVESILAEAGRIRFPDDLVAKRKEDDEVARKKLEDLYRKNPGLAVPAIVEIDSSGNRHVLSKEEARERFLAEPQEPKLGVWPSTADSSPGLTVVTDILKGIFLPKVHIAILPTDDWTTIPAYLHFGGWNACPDAPYHVAALRSWRDRYGIELVGLAFDTFNLTVKHPPRSRDDALALAREQYVYCNDIIDQGVETYSALAASLMANDWWFFWWD
jgi:hypothetical protein